MDADKFFEREYFFEKAFEKAYGNMPDYKLKGWNDALQCEIYNKAHFKAVMKQKGLVPIDEAERLCAQWDKENKPKEYEMSQTSLDIIASLRHSADKHGNLKLGDRAINAMRSIGAINEIRHDLPNNLNVTGGGFYEHAGHSN